MKELHEYEMQKEADWNTCVQNVTFIQESPISGIFSESLSL